VTHRADDDLARLLLPQLRLSDEEPGPGDPKEMKLSIYWPIK